MCDGFSGIRIHSQECSKRLDEKMFEKMVGLQFMWQKLPLGIRSCKHRDCLPPLAFTLPHEIIFKLSKRNTVETLCQTEGATQSVKDHVAKAKECLKGSVIPLGLWSDAIPMNWDRSEPLELILINLPGLPKDSGSTS